MASTRQLPIGDATEPGRQISQRALELLTEHSTDVLCEVREGEIVYVSPNALKVSGRETAEFIGRRMADIVHQDDLPTLAAYTKPGWVGSIRANVRLKDANGAWQWREVRGVRVRDDDGVHRALLILRDISERIRLESALRESERRFRELADAAPFVIYVTDENFQTVFVNKAMLAFTGRTLEEQLAVPLGVNRHPEDAANLRNLSRDAIARRERFTTEQRFHNVDGEYRWLLTDAHPRVDDAGNHAGYIGYSVDITDRHEAEEALRQSEVRAKALLAAIPDLMFRMTRDGVYLDFKADRDADLYVAPERIVGANIRELLPPDVATHVLTAIERTIDTDTTQTIEYSLSKPSGASDYETRITRSGDNEAVLICRDVTERKRAEAALRATEDREALLRDRQRIAQELHDSVAQYFFGIGMAANAALADEGVTGEPLRERLSRIRQLSTEGGQEIREAIHSLGDDPMPDINVAMQVLFEPLRADATDVRYVCLCDSGALPEPLQREVLSIARECLFNVRKHANATRVFVTLRSDSRSHTLTIADDGTGDARRIDGVVQHGGGYGLRSMRTRLRAMGGDVTWENNDGAGVK